MADKVKYITQLNGGLRLDIPSTLMKSSFSTGLRNVKVTKEEITTRDGYEVLGDNLPLDSPVTTLRQFTSYDGDIHTVAFTHDDILRLDPDNNWVSILGTNNWTSDYTLPARTAFINNTLLATNFNNEMVEWDGEASSVNTISNASSYRAKDLVPFNYRMLYGHMEENGEPVPQRVRWTEIGTYDNFTDGYAGFVDLVDTPGSIVAMEPLGESMVIYKDDSIVMCNWVGGKNVFSFETRVSHVGLVAPRGVVNLGDRHLFLAQDNIYEFTGGRTVQPVGEQIQKEVPQLIASEYIERSIATRYGDEAWFIVPIEDEVPDTAYVLNWREGRWYKHDLTSTGLGTYVDADIVTIGDLDMEIGDIGGRIGDLGGVSVRPRIILGDTDGYIYKMSSTKSDDAGTGITNYWDSKDFVLGEEYKTRYNRFRAIEFDAKGDSLEVLYSIDSGESWNYIDEQVLTESYEWHTLWFDDSARKIRFRFRNKNTNESFSLRTFKIIYKEGATR